MRYEFMFPEQLQAAKESRCPLILPIGTIEYHGPHCAYGCDGLIAQGLAMKLEKKHEAVLLPTFWYGASSYAVGGPEKGTVDVTFDAIKAVFSDMFTSLLEGGFRNIVALIHHQYEQETYMPLTLAVASAAKTVTMAFLEKTRGRGWWGSNTCADYYSELDASDNPFNWIRVLPCMSTGAQNATGYDHAGQYECSLLAALYPEAVQLDKLSQSDEWFIQQARLATPGYGHKMIELSLQDLETRIFGETGTTEQ
ncbi:MAG: creatininase family protein [Christensenellales bacterium]|jgi:creatinine amidohydrolase/Fe(II)-dependent formamide hydrolase-like protein